MILTLMIKFICTYLGLHHASAKITNINYQKAKEYKGVLTIISHQTIKKMHINPMYPGFKVKKRWKAMVDTFRNILSDGRVRYVGEPILAIIAETFEIAQEAADFVDIEFEELESTTNLNIAIKPWCSCCKRRTSK